jgi:hypothetical protein
MRVKMQLESLDCTCYVEESFCLGAQTPTNFQPIIGGPLADLFNGFIDTLKKRIAVILLK